MSFKCLQRPPPSSSHQRTRITDLPNEILQLIGGLVHPADRISLALANHSLCNTLGMQRVRPPCWQIGIYRVVGFRFLVSLQRDLDGYMACLQCLKLHRQVHYQTQNTPSQQFETLTACDKLDGGHRFCPHYLLTPRKIQSAFLAKSPCPIPLDHGCGVKMPDGGLLTTRVYAQVTSQGRLLIKTEYCLQLMCDRLTPIKHLEDAMHALPRICPHDRFYDSLRALCCCVFSHKLVERGLNKSQHREFGALVGKCRQEEDRITNMKHSTVAGRLAKDCKHAASLSTGLPRMPFATSQSMQIQIQNSLEEAHAHLAPVPPGPPSSALDVLMPKQESWIPNIAKPPHNRKNNLYSYHAYRYFCTCNVCTVQRHTSASRFLCGAKEEATLITQSPCGRCVAPRRCLFCPTEVHVTVPNDDESTQSEFKLKVECWKDFGQEIEAQAFSKKFLSHRMEPPLEGWWYRQVFDPRTPYLYPVGSLKKAFEVASEETRGGQGRSAKQTKAREIDLDSEMKAVLQDVRLPPYLTRYI